MARTVVMAFTESQGSKVTEVTAGPEEIWACLERASGGRRGHRGPPDLPGFQGSREEWDSQESRGQWDVTGRRGRRERGGETERRLVMSSCDTLSLKNCNDLPLAGLQRF